MTIPKILHICWFGRSTPSPRIAKCLASIEALQQQGYQLHVWNEDNYDLSKSPRLISAYQDKRWSLVSNYVRLDVLARYGGVYLDSDVEIVRDFAPLLQHDFFIGFIWDSTLGTAVIGATPGHRIVKDILATYEADVSSFKSPNNNTFTDYFLKSCLGFVLNGKEQSFCGVKVLDKYRFEHPTLTRRRNYAVHHFAQSWIRTSGLKRIAKSLAIRWLSLWLYRKYVCWKSLRISPYYEEYVKQSRSGKPSTWESVSVRQ